MKWRPVLITLLVAGLLAAAVAWWLRTYELVEQSIDLPRTGEAASNPLYGLRLALERDGVRVRNWRRLEPAAMRLGPHDTVLYDGDLRGLPPAAVQTLLAWLREGGHLIVVTPPPNPAGDAIERERLGRGDGAPRMPVPLLDRLGVHASLEPAECIELTVVADDPHSEFCAGRRFAAPRSAGVRWGDTDGDVFARIRVPGGAGTVDVLAQMDFLATDALEDPTHAAITRQLVAAHDRRGTLHLVHAGALPSLWMTMLREGARAWIPLLLLLLGWLWARSRRFGPMRPGPATGRRSLLEHVAASGEHQWRYGHGDRLHEAMRGAFLARLHRRDPQAAALAGEAQVQRLVERLRMPAPTIRDALATPHPRDARALLARIATLVRMRNRL